MYRIDAIDDKHCSLIDNIHRLKQLNFDSLWASNVSAIQKSKIELRAETQTSYQMRAGKLFNEIKYRSMHFPDYIVHSDEVSYSQSLSTDLNRKSIGYLLKCLTLGGWGHYVFHPPEMIFKLVNKMMLVKNLLISLYSKYVLTYYFIQIICSVINEIAYSKFRFSFFRCRELVWETGSVQPK